jgi:nitrous oxidase accessory protein NosD
VPNEGLVGWTSAQNAYFVVNSSARVPSRRTAIIPFSERSDAQEFARQYGGEIRRWPAVRQLPVGRADRSAREWNEVVRRRQTRANRSVAASRTALNRSVSLVVGQDVRTIAAALTRAPPNTTIVVPPGTYRVDGLRIQKSVTLRGAGSNATHIVGDRNGSVISVSAPRTAIRSLSISGVGPNRTGTNRSVRNISVNKSSWKYQYWKVHGFGDAAVVFDTAPHSLVSDVRVNTTSNGIIARNSAHLTVSELTLYGAQRSREGFLGVAALGSPVIVQQSQIYGGKVGVYTYGASRSVIRNSSMEGMRVGVFDLYSSQLLVANTTIEDTWNAVFVDTRSYGTAVVGNQLNNSRNGIFVRGRSNYVARNMALHNKHGMVVEGQYSLYKRNTLVRNHVGARGLSLYPTNRVTANDFVHNHQYAETYQFNVLHLWRGNYWLGAPGFNWDGDNRLRRTFRPTGAVDKHADEGRGITTLAQSPALTLLRQLQQLLPGLRSAGIIDPQPRASPARPQLAHQLAQTHNGTGRHDDADPWDFLGR